MKLIEVYEPPSRVQAASHVDSMSKYEELHSQSVDPSNAFWIEWANKFHWSKQFSNNAVCEHNFDPKKGPVVIKWFYDGMTNLCYNCLDKNIDKGLGDHIAFQWIGNELDERNSYTYNEILHKVKLLTAALRKRGVKKGDRVAIYMPMIVELPVSMLACARIGAVHTVVFGGFSAHAVQDRILDADCKVILTCNGDIRGTKKIGLLNIALHAIQMCAEKGHAIEHCIIARHPHKELASEEFDLKPGRDEWMDDVLAQVDLTTDNADVEWLDAEDNLFILYTSGSTGKPKGILHTVGGYMVYAAATSFYTFDLKPTDILYCTADIGWITGHTYVVYGPLLNGITSVMFNGLPTHPGPDRYWRIVDQLQVTKLYTAPTALRALIKFGDEPVKQHSRSTLQVLGSVGEPIDRTTWEWYYRVVGNERCSVVDTYWQTETGGHVLTPLPGCTPAKPGSACRPFFGVDVALKKDDAWYSNHICKEDDSPEVMERVSSGMEEEGCLVISRPWPGMMRSIWGNHARFEKVYFSRFPGFYTTGDGARRDQDGYIWITGRIDDMLNMSGHLLSTAEVESALMLNENVSECAVIGKRHAVKGECLYAYVVLKMGREFSAELRASLNSIVREEIGPIATIDYIQESGALPKTRSGKVIRRILRHIAEGETELGDTTTLADPSIIPQLVEGASRLRK